MSERLDEKDLWRLTETVWRASEQGEGEDVPQFSSENKADEVGKEVLSCVKTEVYSGELEACLGFLG